MSFASLKTTLNAMKTAVTKRPPFCSGNCPIPVDEFALYYGRDENARFVNTSAVVLIYS